MTFMQASPRSGQDLTASQATLGVWRLFPSKSVLDRDLIDGFFELDHLQRRRLSLALAHER